MNTAGMNGVNGSGCDEEFSHDSSKSFGYHNQSTDDDSDDDDEHNQTTSLENAYQNSKIEASQKQHMLDEMRQKFEVMQEQMGTYYDLVDKYERAKTQILEYGGKMVKMQNQFEKQAEETKSEYEREILYLKNQLEESENRNVKLKAELALANRRRRNDDNKKEKGTVEEENLGENEVIINALEDQNKSLEDDIVSLKLELANSLSMEDRHKLELRLMSSQLSSLRNQEPKRRSERTLNPFQRSGSVPSLFQRSDSSRQRIQRSGSVPSLSQRSDSSRQRTQRSGSVPSLTQQTESGPPPVLSRGRQLLRRLSYRRTSNELNVESQPETFSTEELQRKKSSPPGDRSKTIN